MFDADAISLSSLESARNQETKTLNTPKSKKETRTPRKGRARLGTDLHRQQCHRRGTSARRRPGTPWLTLQETKKTELSKHQNPRNRRHQVEEEQRAWEPTFTTPAVGGGVIVFASIPPLPPDWRWPRRPGSIVGGLALPCHLSLASATTALPRNRLKSSGKIEPRRGVVLRF
jgi:hypothetical protein